MEKYIYRGKLERVVDGDTIDAIQVAAEATRSSDEQSTTSVLEGVPGIIELNVGGVVEPMEDALAHVLCTTVQLVDIGGNVGNAGRGERLEVVARGAARRRGRHRAGDRGGRRGGRGRAGRAERARRRRGRRPRPRASANGGRGRAVREQHAGRRRGRRPGPGPSAGGGPSGLTRGAELREKLRQAADDHGGRRARRSDGGDVR